MPESKLQIEPSETLGVHVYELRAVPEGDEVFTALLKALVGFRKYDFRESFPKFYSVSGDVYAFRFHPSYILTFVRRVETSPGKPDTVILKLWSIQKA